MRRTEHPIFDAANHSGGETAIIGVRRRKRTVRLLELADDETFGKSLEGKLMET